MSIILAIISMPSRADVWWYVASVDGGTDFYLSPSFAKQPQLLPNIVRAWSLWNSTEPNEQAESSSKFLHDYDCMAEAWRPVHYQTFEKPMGTGALLTDYVPKNPTWDRIPEETAASQLLKVVCHGFN